MQDENEFEHINIIELRNSSLVVLKNSVEALMVSLRLNSAQKNAQELLNKKLEKYGMLFVHVRSDGNLVYILDKVNFEKYLDAFEWPKRLQLFGHYLEQGSFYGWSNYHKTPWEEFEFLIYETIENGQQIQKTEHWLIENNERKLKSTEIENHELPSANPDPLVIDIAHWRLEDKTFQNERKANWPIIEDVLTSCWGKRKKFVNVIKKYYMKGELPDWVALNNVDQSSDLYDGHLDIATFLWLHPSNDEKILTPLAKAYCAGYGRLPSDIQVGVRFLFEWGMFPENMRRADWKAKCSCFQGKARLLFNLIYACLEGGKLHMEVKGPWRTDVVHEIQHPGWSHFIQSTDWLCPKKLAPYQDEMLFQHEEVLHLAFQMVNSNPDDALYWLNEFPDGSTRALYRIANFDAEKEGDTPRTRYINNVRKILDKGTHVQEIEDLWLRLKNSELEVKNPWKI